MIRYCDEPKKLYDFMHTFVVHCPKCNDKADVHVQNFLDFKNAKLNCRSCHFSEKINDRIRYVLKGKIKCTHCQDWLNLEMAGKKNIPKYVNIKCAACKKINKISGNWTEIFLKYHDHGIIDPVFCLPLWYVETIKNDVIWAYNIDHLEAIKTYVASTLRERNSDQFKMTMVEKLPDFIKLAKNREEVLKAIERMERKTKE